MKALFASVYLVLLATSGYTQLAPSGEPAEVQVIKYSWAKERIGWERDPLSAPIETFNEMRVRVATERRSRSAIEERMNRESRIEQKNPPPPPRYVFCYKLTLHNSGNKTIGEVDWDYVFSDAATGEELGRREFTSVEKIGPGKTKELIVRLTTPPAQTISAYSLGKNEREGLVETVSVVAVRYVEPDTAKAHNKSRSQ